MFGSPRFWFGVVGRGFAWVVAACGQLLVACLTVAVGVMLFPGPWDASRAQAAKARPGVGAEVVALRSAHSKTVREADGSLRTVVSQQSLHFYDASSEVWESIDASFKDSAKQGVRWASGANRFSVELAATSKAGFLSLTTDAGPVSVSLEGASEASGVKADENVVSFPDVLQGVDLEYALLPDGLKENLVLRERDAPSSYRFTLQPETGVRLRAEEREDGSVWFFADDSAEPAFVVLAPVAGDSADQALPQPPSAVTAPESWSAARGKVAMAVDEQKDGSFTLTLEIDKEWLSSAQRVFPVVVDPTVFVQPDVADGEYDTTSGGTPNVSAGEIRTGRNGAGAAKYASTLTFDLAEIPPGAKVLDAGLNAYLNACFPTSCGTGHTGDVELRALNSPGWSPATPWASVSVASTLLAKVSFTTTPTLTWQRWTGQTLTQTLQGMVNGTSANYGLILEKNGGNDAIGYKWRSSRWSDPSFAPYLDITWVADGVQLNPSVNLHANGAELYWQHFAGGASAYLNAVLADAPVAYFRLNEASGSTVVADSSGSGVSASVQNATGVQRAEAGALADLDLSTRLLGSPAGYVKVADNPVIRVNDTLTLEAWIKRSDLTARDMSLFNDFGSGFWLRVNTANKLELRKNGVGSIVQSTTTIADTHWHHVAATKQGSTVKLFIDGADVTGTVTNQTLVSSTSGFHIGATDGVTLPFYGWIDEAALYPTALSQTRVQAHYSAAATALPGFQRFEVHRGSQAGFTPSAATLVGTVADSSAQTFRDTTAKPASTFFYKVVTVTDAGSFPSNELRAELPAQGHGEVVIQPGFLTGSARGTHITSAAPTTEQGNSQSIIVGSAGSNTTRALLAFDMHVVPTGATVSSAQVEMYALQSTGALNLHRVSASWKEGGATWNHRDKYASLNWATTGGDFDSTATASSAGGSYQHWDSWEIGALLQQWIDGTQGHEGVLIKYGSENGSQSTVYYAADGFSRSIALRPRLTISYEDGSTAVAPTVAVSQPVAAETVKGTVTVKAGAVDDGAVTQVQFLLDGNALGSADTTAPYEVSWNTTGASNGSHTLSARATDEAGNQQTSAGVSVTVANSAAPTTSVTNATAGGAGVWTVTASASDDVSVSKVEFYVDGDRFATDTSSPYSVSLDTLAFPVYDGSRTLTSRAYDADGNTTTSSGYPITVANTSGTKYKATLSTTGMPREQRYDPAAGTQDGAPLTVSLTNTSTQSWPTASIKLRYRWLSADATPVVTDSANVSIGADLGAGQQRNVAVTVDPPTLPTNVYRARYLLRIDLYDTGASSYFAGKGNAPFEQWVTVTRRVDDELGLERYQYYSGEELGGGVTSSLNLANGNNAIQWTPFSQPGRGINTNVTLTYNSLEHGSVSPVGNNWSLSLSSLTPFGLPLDVHPNAADTAAGRTQKWVGFTDADGSYHVFTGNSGGTYYTAPPGVHLYLKATGGTGWELWKPDRTRFVYDAAGYPTAVQDANGNALTYTLATPAAGEDAYALAKRVTAVTDAGGRDFTLTYYTKAETPTRALRGKLKTLTDHVGHALEFTYYEDGNLRSIRERGGAGDDGMPTPTRELILTYTTPTGSGPAIATYTARQNPDPATVHSSKLYSLIDFRGGETQYTYSTAADAKQWRVTGRTDRAGNQTTLAYNTTTRETTETKPLSRVWVYTFDTEGRVTKLDDPVNSADTTIEWADATASNEVTNTIRKVTAPSGEYVEYAYNANGYRTDTWDELRNHTTFEYTNIAVDANDASGNWEPGRSIPHISQLTALVKPRGNATTGNPTDYRWTFTYTASGLVATITDPLGNVTTNTWNTNGTLATQTLPANGDGITRTTTYNTYDTNGLPTQVTDPAGGISKAAYAANGNLLWEQDANHASYTGGTPSHYRSEYLYDAHGRLTATSQPKSTVLTPGLLIWETTGYDANDNETLTQAAHYGRGDGRNGAVTTATYDAMDRDTLVTGPRGAADGGPDKTKTEYDAAGRITRTTTPNGVDTPAADDYVTQTSYDLLDREQTVTNYATESGATRVTNYCYDDAGDLRSITAPKGASSFTSCPSPTATPYVYTTAPYTQKLEYDAAHRQTKQTDPLNRVTETTYDENGQTTLTTDPAGKSTQTVYDDRGLRSKLIEPFDTGRTLTTISEYDALGNLKRLITPRAYDTAGGQAPYTDHVESYSYDALSRLVTTTLPTSPTFSTVIGNQTPYAYWRLGEASGTTMTDSSGNGRNGTYVNSPTLGVAGPLIADTNTAMKTPASNYQATAASIALANQSFSISLWMKRPSINSTDYAVGQGTQTSNNGLRIGFISTNKFRFGFYNNDLDTTPTYTDLDWHHWVLTYNATSNARTIYRDGLQVAADTAAADYAGTGNLVLASTAWNAAADSMPNGFLDEVAVWTRELTASEAAAQYATGTTGATAAAYRHQAYDAIGNQLWTSLPTTAATPAGVTAQEKTTVAYWDPGWIASSRDPAIPTVRFDYTAEGWQAGRVAEQTAQPGTLDLLHAMYWEYLPDGLLRARVDEEAERALYFYDANGNRTQALEATGVLSPGQTALQVDSSYDSLDQPTKVRTPKPGVSGTYLATLYAYDLHGNTTRLTDNREENSGGSQTAAGRVFDLTYDAADQPTAQTDDYATGSSTDDEQLTYTYTTRGELDTQTLQKRPSGSWVNEQSSARTYFDNGLLKTLTNKNGSGTMIESHTLGYETGGVFLNGNRAFDTYQLKGPSATAPCYSATCTAAWAYDARERVTSDYAGTGDTTFFTLDVQGNAIQETTGANGTARTYTGQQLQTEDYSTGTDRRYLYDSLGDVDCIVKLAYAGTSCPAAGSSDLLEDYLYDYKRQLTGYRYYNGAASASKTTDITLDPLERPASQTETISGATTSYAYTYLGDTTMLAKEVLTGSGATTKRYAYDATGARATISEGSNRYSYLYDPHGSISLLIDQNNTVKESYAYTAYGAPNSALTKTAAGFNTKTNPYRYTGKRQDTASSLLDMGARRYSATSGRFLQVDLYTDALDNLGLSQDPLTQNRYALAAGNPVNYVELDGHRVEAVNDANPGDRLYILLSEQQAVDEAASKCGNTDKCPSSKAKVVGGAELLSLFVPTGFGRLALRLGLGRVYLVLQGSRVPKVTDKKLANIVRNLYSAADKPTRVGRGTTSDAVRHELRTGEMVGGKFHIQKAHEGINGLRNLLRSGQLNDRDRRIAVALLRDLRDALKTGKKGR